MDDLVPTLLPALIVALSIVAVGSALILVRATLIRPRIGALTERAAIAVVIALFGAVYSFVALNTELRSAILTTDEGRTLVRCMVVVLLAIPAWWTWLYLGGRLGGGK